MTDIIYGPVDATVKKWLATRLLTVAVYMAMPKAPPPQVVLVSLVSGGPAARADLPLTRYRLSFDCIAKTRDDASALSRRVMTELVELGDGGGQVVDGVYLGGADILLYRWQPDPDSDLPRYIVDALITTVH
ncbi:MAG: hypothetical protein ABWX96_13535 [Propionibacteriaceae bacterium]